MNKIHKFTHEMELPRMNWLAFSEHGYRQEYSDSVEQLITDNFDRYMLDGVNGTITLHVANDKLYSSTEIMYNTTFVVVYPFSPTWSICGCYSYNDTQNGTMRFTTVGNLSVLRTGQVSNFLEKLMSISYISGNIPQFIENFSVTEFGYAPMTWFELIFNMSNGQLPSFVCNKLANRPFVKEMNKKTEEVISVLDSSDPTLKELKEELEDTEDDNVVINPYGNISKKEILLDTFKYIVGRFSLSGDLRSIGIRQIDKEITVTWNHHTSYSHSNNKDCVLHDQCKSALQALNTNEFSFVLSKEGIGIITFIEGNASTIMPLCDTSDIVEKIWGRSKTEVVPEYDNKGSYLEFLDEHNKRFGKEWADDLGKHNDLLVELFKTNSLFMHINEIKDLTLIWEPNSLLVYGDGRKINGCYFNIAKYPEYTEMIKILRELGLDPVKQSKLMCIKCNDTWRRVWGFPEPYKYRPNLETKREVDIVHKEAVSEQTIEPELSKEDISKHHRTKDNQLVTELFEILARVPHSGNETKSEEGCEWEITHCRISEYDLDHVTAISRVILIQEYDLNKCVRVHHAGIDPNRSDYIPRVMEIVKELGLYSKYSTELFFKNTDSGWERVDIESLLDRCKLKYGTERKTTTITKGNFEYPVPTESLFKSIPEPRTISKFIEKLVDITKLKNTNNRGSCIDIFYQQNPVLKSKNELVISCKNPDGERPRSQTKTYSWDVVPNDLCDMMRDIDIINEPHQRFFYMEDWVKISTAGPVPPPPPSTVQLPSIQKLEKMIQDVRKKRSHPRTVSEILGFGFRR